MLEWVSAMTVGTPLVVVGRASAVLPNDACTGPPASTRPVAQSFQNRATIERSQRPLKLIDAKPVEHFAEELKGSISRMRRRI